MNYRDLCVDKEINIRDAMKKLDETAKKILFILDGDKPAGSLTDGDIRRFLLDGGKMDSPALAAANKEPHTAKNLKEAKQISGLKNFIAIPIVANDKTLENVYFGDGGEEVKRRINIPVIVNAGGKGTRLAPFTKVLPKPLIPVGELPIIEHIMQEFKKYECEDFHVIVNYKKQLIKAYFKENENAYNINYYDEEKPLGTGGGLSLLKGKMDSTFFFTNCDILLLSDYADMIDFHKKNGNVITMVCAYKNITIPYGVIDMGKNGSILGMQEKPELSFLTNTGMYIVEPEVLDDIEDDVPIGFPDIIEAQRQKGRNVAVYPVSENDWMDMGQIPELEQMRIRLYGE